jgi:flagellar biosynthetic protein FliR
MAVSEHQLLILFLVLLRMSSFVVAWPIFGVQQVPPPVKILFAVLFAILLAPTLGEPNLSLEEIENSLIWLSLKEVFIGLLLGYLMRLFFFAVSIGGEIISMSMGLSSAQLLNPAMGGEGSVIEQFEVAMATLFFLAINGHHLFLTGLVESFQVLPMSLSGLNFELFAETGKLVQEIMVIGLKISSPILAAILFTNVAMGILGRAVPQINVFITSLPVNILLGFFIIALSIPLFVEEMGFLLNEMTEAMFEMMKGL